MAKEGSKIKKFVVTGLKVLGIVALVWLAFRMAQGKSLWFDSMGDTQTGYTDSGYSGTQDYVYEDSSGSVPAPAASWLAPIPLFGT